MMDSDKAKIFVGGISGETTEDTLKHYFAKYGTVLDSTISLDRTTRIPRGFGFVTFSHISEAQKAFQDTHVILGRTVEVKKAIPRSEQQHHGNNYGSSYEYSCEHIRTKKIFVGGLPADISEEEFKTYFEKFGTITDVVVMQDSVTHRPRGFGFITFDTEESVQSVMVKKFHDMNGRQVEVKRAVPKNENPSYDSFNRFKSGSTEIFPHYSSRNILPGVSPLPWYNSEGLYGYGSNAYGCWYPVGGYGGNGYVVPSYASRDTWYGQMIPGPQLCQWPYSNAMPIVGYVGGVVAGSSGYNGILGSAKNLKVNQSSNANGYVPGNGPLTHGVKQNVDSSSFSGSNGQISI